MPRAFAGLALIGVALAGVAAIAAALITYDEYQRHFPDPAPARRAAAEAALFAFVFFLVLAMLAAWYFGTVL